jgi:alpha/beta superfamily hydrolase
MNTQHAFSLNADGHALSATLFLPRAPVCGAVLFVPPFVEERKGALPVFAQTARALAARGFASLLFDFSGCGDSEGAFDEQTPAAFEADCEAARAWLARAFPSRPVAVLGLRCGALLAARLAQRHPETTAACVQWAPVTGADFVRQLLQRRMVNDMVAYGKAREGRADLEAHLRRGETVDLDGYPVSGAFHAWLLDLVPQPCSVPLCLASGGHDVKTAAACASGACALFSLALRFPPFWNTVGHVDLAALVEETAVWLANAGTTASATPSTPPPAEQIPPPPDIRLPFIGPEGAVSAIFDPPEGPPRAGALFLHGWSGDRTGPHRLFTRFARQLARQGYLCLRPDFTGRGLSGGAASDASISGMSANAQAALLALRQRLPPGAPVVVIAICSGCKVAITLAAADRDIARLVLWSAESMGDLRSAATGLRKTLNLLGTYARKLSRPETWKKLLSGKVQTGMVTKALVKQETRSAAEAARENDVLKQFRKFRNPLLFVFGGSDPDASGSSRAYARYCRRHDIPQLSHTVAHAGHSYYGEAWTRELFEVSLGFLKEQAAPTAEGEELGEELGVRN